MDSLQDVDGAINLTTIKRELNNSNNNSSNNSNNSSSNSSPVPPLPHNVSSAPYFIRPAPFLIIGCAQPINNN